MKTMLIYDKLVSLHREHHRELKLAPSEQNLAFARETNSLLIAAAELPLAALDFPCVFIAGQDGGHAIAALVGLRDQENLFVQADGAWQRGSYVPAFVRRYPFVLAESDGNAEFTVCVDQAYPGLNKTSGQALFDDAGRETPWLEEVKRFLVNFRQEMNASRAFADRLAELGLLQDGVIEYTLAGERSTLRGFLTVDEARLRALPAEAREELFAKGWMGLIYAHLLSLNQVQRLALRLEDRQAAATEPVPVPEPAEAGALH